MEKLGQVVNKVVAESQTQSKLRTLSQKSGTGSSRSSGFSASEMEAIVTELGYCQVSVPTYGRQASDLKVTAKVLMNDLQEFGGVAIAEAIAKQKNH